MAYTAYCRSPLCRMPGGG